MIFQISRPLGDCEPVNHPGYTRPLGAGGFFSGSCKGEDMVTSKHFSRA